MTATSGSLSVLHIDSADGYRGGQKQVRTLLAGLQAAGGIRQALAAPEGARLLAEAADLGVPTVPLRWTSPVDPRALRRLARLVGYRWDAVHAHDSHGLQLALAALAVRGGRAPVVASRRVGFPLRSPFVWRRANLVLAVSSAVRRGLVEQGLEPRRVRVVHDGVDPEPALESRPAALRMALGLDADMPLVAALGALDDQKDHATFVRAAGRIRDRAPRAMFAVFGEGPRRGALEALIAECGLTERFMLPGHVPDAARSLVDLDLFVMSSTVEGLGSAALEAIAAGVPVVLTSGGGLADVLGDLDSIAPGDDQAMAEMIAGLLANPVFRAERAEAGVLRARAFTAERMVRRTVQCYLTLAGRSGAGR